VPLVIDQKFIGLGYGVVTSVQNGGLAAFPLVIAAIYDSSGSLYIPNVELFFVALAMLGVVVGFYLNYYDYYNDMVFNLPAMAYRKLADEDDDDDLRDVKPTSSLINNVVQPSITDTVNAMHDKKGDV